MDLIYLDYNCFQRSFDDPKQIKIQLEALACEEIFSRAETKKVQLIWSFMHEDENVFCPFGERKLEVYKLSLLCERKIVPNTGIFHLAKDFQQNTGLSSKDALHLACACSTKCNFFLTCDEELIKKSRKLAFAIKILNPVEYIRGGKTQ